MLKFWDDPFSWGYLGNTDFEPTSVNALNSSVYIRQATFHRWSESGTIVCSLFIVDWYEYFSQREWVDCYTVSFEDPV